MHLSTLFYVLICLATAQQPAIGSNSVTIDNCTIFLADEAKVPAQEGGVIEILHVKDGQAVKRGDQLVQIDDSIPKQQLAVANAELASAKVEAKNDIPRQYAVASKDVADQDLKVSREANRKVPGTVPEVNLRKLELECTQMKLSIEKAEMDTKIAVKKVDVKQAQLDAADVTLKHRQLISPLDGQVRKIYRHLGEWVNAGEPVMHVVRMDRLYIEGSLLAAEVPHTEVNGKPVDVEVILARDRSAPEQTVRYRTAKVRGTIVFVDPMIEAGGEYLVRAEVDNIVENRQWVLHPGMTAKMTIHLK
jgi:multidrug efflux pump subunit AcrA (membrane-fusion protein)